MSKENVEQSQVWKKTAPPPTSGLTEPAEVLGHPKGLFFLFFAELWERFSFYGMRALLTLYMVEQLYVYIARDSREALAYSIYAAYGALVYATPFIGGLMADRILGYRKAIVLGGILMALGHFTLAFEHEFFFFAGLALIVAGNGFFKPNISTFVGTLYKEKDPRRDAGFNIFYMGINIGAWAAPLACGWLAVEYGWHYGFAAAGIGMVIGLLLFLYGLKAKVFADRGLPPEKSTPKKRNLVSLFSFLAVPLIGLLLYENEFVGYILYIALIPITIILIRTMVKEPKLVWQRLIAALILTFFMTMFWAFFEQGGSSLTIYASKSVNLGLGMNAAQTNSINPFFIVIFALLFSFLWTYLSRIGKNPYTPIKYSMGIAQLGLGFLIFAAAANFMNDSAQVPFLFLVMGYLFISTGELFLSPVGLSKLTELSTKKIAGFMMGVWFLSAAFGHHIAGIIAKLTTGSRAEEGGVFMGGLVEKITGMSAASVQGAPQPVQDLFTYSTVFTQIGIIALGLAVVALVLTPVMRKWMHGIH